MRQTANYATFPRFAMTGRVRDDGKLSTWRHIPQIETLSGLPPRRPRFDRFDHTFTQIIPIWLRHRPALPKDESMQPDPPTDTPFGNPYDSTQPEHALRACQR
jgi:hypothetical protein